ncbi:MSHA biogenesis protein MshP [Vibrio lamellibrachiae]|uniref:MSHA biogenesis protein MshP n=1 Tax=Vibrio lamellibrachiae TaxID=2910253 RepID=UPI003D0E1AA8
MSRRSGLLNGRRKQSGTVYIIAIFVLVVMGFLGTALTRMEWSNSDALTRDALGTQAWLLSHSANELVLTHMYPLNSVSEVVADTCIDEPARWESVESALQQLASQHKNCSTIESTCGFIGELDGVRFYKVESSAICGTGINYVQRTQEVWVKE